MATQEIAPNLTKASEKNHTKTLAKNLTIIVGDPEASPTTFIVPETLLTAKSPFFKAATRSNWKEAAHRLIKLPEAKPHVFSRYLTWIYQGVVSTRFGPQSTHLETSFKDEACQDLVEFWVLADQLADIPLGNRIIDVPFNEIESGEGPQNLLSSETVNLIWASTTEGRGLRRMMVEGYKAYAGSRWLDEHIDEFEYGFVRELLVATAEMMDDEVSYKSARFDERGNTACEFHEHGDRHPQWACYMRSGGH